VASARCCHLRSRSIAFVVPAGSRACHALGPSRSAALMIQASTRWERQGACAVGTHSNHSWSSRAVSRAGRSRAGAGPLHRPGTDIKPVYDFLHQAEVLGGYEGQRVSHAEGSVVEPAAVLQKPGAARGPDCRGPGGRRCVPLQLLVVVAHRKPRVPAVPVNQSTGGARPPERPHARRRWRWPRRPSGERGAAGRYGGTGSRGGGGSQAWAGARHGGHPLRAPDRHGVRGERASAASSFNHHHGAFGAPPWPPTSPTPLPPPPPP
jgi:hypothetical protein